MYVREDLSFNELRDKVWGNAEDVLDIVYDRDKEDEFMSYLEELNDDWELTELNDFISYESEQIYEALGLDENGNLLIEYVYADDLIEAIIQCEEIEDATESDWDSLLEICRDNIGYGIDFLAGDIIAYYELGDDEELSQIVRDLCEEYEQ